MLEIDNRVMIKKQALMMVAVIFIVILTTPAIYGDGISVVDETLYSTLRENRQLAYIEVNENYEILHLFLSVVSLNPGEKITILLPVRTSPMNITIGNLTDSEFYQHHSLFDIERKKYEITHAITPFTDSFSILSMYQLLGYGGVIYMMFSSVGSGGTSSATYSFPTGDSITVYNFTNIEDIDNFYKSLNMTVPDNVRNIMEKYHDYYLIALNAKTRAPIETHKFEELERKCPQSIEKLKEYVSKNPMVKAKIYSIYYLDLPNDKDLKETIREEAGKNYTLERYFWDTVASIYGVGTAQGFEVSMKLPLFKGMAFYPLGTSPSWKSEGDIRVFFKIPTSLDIAVNDDNYVFIHKVDYNYYIWNYDKSFPNHDIEGKVIPRNFNTEINEQVYSIKIWLYENPGYSSFLAFIFLFFIWYISLLSVMYIWKKKINYENLKSITKISIATFLLSFLVTSFLGAFLALFMVNDLQNPIYFGDKWFREISRKRKLSGVLVFSSILAIQYTVSFFYLPENWGIKPIFALCLLPIIIIVIAILMILYLTQWRKSESA